MRYYILAAVLLAADQLSKLAVRVNMQVGESISVIGDFFRLTHIQNSGAAFSMFSGQRLILIALPVAAMGAALWYLHSHRGRHWSLYTSWTMIIAGGIGNLIDRIAMGSVTDMLDFSIFPPIFNVADICVCAGCALFAAYVLADGWQKKD